MPEMREDAEPGRPEAPDRRSHGEVRRHAARERAPQPVRSIAALWLLILVIVLTGCRTHQARAKISPAVSGSKITLTCSFDRPSVIANSGETIPVHVRANSPTQYRLGYFWTSPEGTFKGTGPDMQWNPHNALPGTYSISVRVDDGHGGEATCSMQVQVEPKSSH